MPTMRSTVLARWVKQWARLVRGKIRSSGWTRSLQGPSCMVPACRQAGGLEPRHVLHNRNSK